MWDVEKNVAIYYFCINSKQMDLFTIPRCNQCPRQCNALRDSLSLGYCRSTNEPEIASICIHKGEEPVLSGIHGVCNLFFSHCNLQCVYCQNYQISLNSTGRISNYTLSSACDAIAQCLDAGIKIVGFVSPSHQVLAMVEIVNELKRRSYAPRILYNSNGYDRVDILRELEDVVDIYLPDFKYGSNELGRQLSAVPDYFDAASLALKEMFRQKGTYLSLDDDEVAESGLIIRHLVLPGFVSNSIEVLDYIAREISPNVHISLMAQYSPPFAISNFTELNRPLTVDEYRSVTSHFEALGFHKGWVQELCSALNYNPDFTKKHPFEL